MTDILSDDHVLCCVAHGTAYFTDDLESQWGDDWNDAPYEHNAEPPYFGRPHHTTTVRTLRVDGLREPYEIHGGINSPWSVQDINGGAVPWLDNAGDVEIYAGTTMSEFVRLVYEAGGVVFHPDDDQRLLRPEDEMSDRWIDARERRPKKDQLIAARSESGSVTAGNYFGGAVSGGYADWSWDIVDYWMPLPPPPERDDKAVLLEDVFGGEWKKVLPNAYDRVDCGVHATVQEGMVQAEYQTEDTTLCVTVYYEEEQSTRKGLEILRNELREMHDAVGALLDVDRSERDA